MLSDLREKALTSGILWDREQWDTPWEVELFQYSSYNLHQESHWCVGLLNKTFMFLSPSFYAHICGSHHGAHNHIIFDAGSRLQAHRNVVLACRELWAVHSGQTIALLVHYIVHQTLLLVNSSSLLVHNSSVSFMHDWTTV